MTTPPILIALFAKPPRAGEVKTRLTPLVGEEGAAELAGAFLLDALRLVDDLPWARVVLASTGPFPKSFARAIGGRPVWAQGPGDLGARMERVIARGLDEGAGAAIALGTDCPGLGASHLVAARDALLEHEAVLGPSPDGGYYLVGLRRCPEGAFSKLPWSRPETFARTRSRFESLGLSVGLAPPFPDVDEPEDLLRLEAALREGRLEAKATRAALRALGRLDQDLIEAPLRDR